MVPEELSMASTSSDPNPPGKRAASALAARRTFSHLGQHTRGTQSPSRSNSESVLQCTTMPPPIFTPRVILSCLSSKDLDSTTGVHPMGLASGLYDTRYAKPRESPSSALCRRAACSTPGVERAAQTPVTVRKSGTRMKLVARKRPPNR